MPSHRHKITHKEKPRRCFQHLGARPVLKLQSFKPMESILKPHPIGCKCHVHGVKSETQTPLGNSANLRAKPTDPMAARVQRFSTQSAAREILPKTRTAKCLRLPTGRTPDVQVWKSKAHHTTSYRGLQTCGSVWACPVCAAKIAERRRIELLEAMEMHKAQGGAVSLLTLTTPTSEVTTSRCFLEQQGNALQGFLRDRKVKEVFSEMGYLGQVRALEVTHGRRSDRNNGWHPISTFSSSTR